MKKFKVKTYCNIFGEHNCSQDELIDKITVEFDTLFEAIVYLFECTYPITHISDLIPDFNKIEDDENLINITSTCKDLDLFVKNQKDSEFNGMYTATVTAFSYYNTNY
tara:strand:- start:1381 stop:1704 length:324 start_codon:yes stop_codon:yes gene_type:complete